MKMAKIKIMKSQKVELTLKKSNNNKIKKYRKRIVKKKKKKTKKRRKRKKLLNLQKCYLLVMELGYRIYQEYMLDF